MSQAKRILASLAIGLLLGILSARYGSSWVENAIAVGEPIGTMWLDALRMTIIPLIVSLLITGIAASAEAVRASRLAFRAVILFMAVLWSGAIMSAFMTPLLLRLWPMPAEAAARLRDALTTSSQEVGQIPTLGQFLTSVIPTNPIAAAANDAILPLIFFTVVFAFALTRLAPAQRELLTGFFRAIADAMLVIINWVLWLAPLGVFALAYVVGARAGLAAFGALIHYVIVIASIGAIVWLAAWPLAFFGARIGPRQFTRAIGPSHAVAISTQSSLASLPAMLGGAEKVGVPVAASGVTLPLAVALFRATGPAMNLAVAIYVANWFGIPLGPMQIAAGVAVAATTTLGSISLPGSVSFISAIGPICIAMGVPIEPLVLLVAVETLPDIIRTTGNVAMDVATTATVAKRSGFDESSPLSEQDRLLQEEPA
ncbi:dicarboxylate/amino acid:cation symporter [Sphingosinicella sp. BN140058]|uniref:dicarboxylate/amino acid:cation symporter n=1 Tax=Sphingosinicella sp. BN140058 TaxID=1892855 RepID=UPI0010120C77|nr:cation:dicarboxylase symporter family transporter [Sphingosinicella sp. BN140058]QAY76072.1 cation:dicarboxylase symporter family transporter [Sphingosinicella sp. BN140058]